jgi:AraC family transcriptional regulator, ethanolamine operon transcriptional activator
LKSGTSWTIIKCEKQNVSNGQISFLSELMSIRLVQGGQNGEQAVFPFRPGLRLLRAYRDPDEMSAGSVHWGIEQSQLGPGRFDGGTRAIHSGQVQMSYSHRNPGLMIRGAIPSQAVVLSSVVRLSTPVLFNGKRLGDHQVMWTDSRSELDLRTIGGNELVTVAVDAPLFDAVARASLGPAFFDAERTDRFSLNDAECRRRLNRRLLALLDEGFMKSDRMSEVTYRRNWEFHVMSAWLADVNAPDPRATPSARHRAARHAETFLRCNPDRPISVAELCLLTGVAKRTLMLGFQEAFGMSPLAYHRRFRLNEARRELIRSLPHAVTVAQVALRWGFDHFGRFSVDYRNFFGETPTMTMRSMFAKSGLI